MAENKDCILFATADWDTPYWTNKQHTARLLASRGWRVLYVESVGLRKPSMTSSRDWGRLFRRLLQGIRSVLFGPALIEQNLWVLSPLMLPGIHHIPLIRAFNQGLMHTTLVRFAKRERFSIPMVWTYHPFMLESITGLQIGPLVYHCVDDLAVVPGVDSNAFNKEEIRLLKKCNVVFTTAQPLKEKCLPHNSNTHFFPNVVDATHFGRALIPGDIPADLAAIPEPRLVYHGALSDFKVDFELIHQVAKIQPNWQWIFIGDEREGQSSPLVSQLMEFPNVHFLGYRSYEILPDYLRGMSVGLLPTLLNSYTHSMFPMKYYEYIAAGLHVVSTPLQALSERNNLCKFGSNAIEFTKAISFQLNKGKLLPEDIIEYIGENTWEIRMNKMLEIIFI